MRGRCQLTTFHFTPPSSERQTEPWSAVWISAYTRLEFVGATATSILPIGGFGSPGSSTCFHVSPPSRVTHTPSLGSFVPLYIAYVCMITCHMPANSTF